MTTTNITLVLHSKCEASVPAGTVYGVTTSVPLTITYEGVTHPGESFTEQGAEIRVYCQAVGSDAWTQVSADPVMPGQVGGTLQRTIPAQAAGLASIRMDLSTYYGNSGWVFNSYYLHLARMDGDDVRPRRYFDR